jgi:hypothetical protein
VVARGAVRFGRSHLPVAGYVCGYVSSSAGGQDRSLSSREQWLWAISAGCPLPALLPRSWRTGGSTSARRLQLP